MNCQRLQNTYSYVFQILYFYLKFYLTAITVIIHFYCYSK